MLCACIGSVTWSSVLRREVVVFSQVPEEDIVSVTEMLRAQRKDVPCWGSRSDRPLYFENAEYGGQWATKTVLVLIVLSSFKYWELQKVSRGVTSYVKTILSSGHFVWFDPFTKISFYFAQRQDFWVHILWQHFSLGFYLLSKKRHFFIVRCEKMKVLFVCYRDISPSSVVALRYLTIFDLRSNKLFIFFTNDLGIRFGCNHWNKWFWIFMIKMFLS